MTVRRARRHRIALAPLGLKSTRPRAALAAAVILGCAAGAWRPGAVGAEEYSILTGSTVVGSDAGHPTGTRGDEPTPLGATDLVVESAFFFKTLEIFAVPGVLGETYTGYRVPLRLRHRANAQLTFELGAVLGHDLGDDDPLNVVRPLVRLAYEPRPRIHVLAGTILPTHWMHDAMLDDVRRFNAEVEQGFQLRIDRPRLKQDTWLNWRVREQAVRAEEFEIGSAWRWLPWGGRLGADAQFLWTHAGGQVSASGRIDQNLVYLLGASAGSAVPDASGVLPTPGWRLLWNWLYDRQETDSVPLHEGFGSEAAARLDLGLGRDLRARVFCSRWWGRGLEASLGDPLYGLRNYEQLGVNLVAAAAGGGLLVEAGFVRQWTGEGRNLTYQLTMTWGQAFGLK